MTYQLTQGNSIQRLSDGAFIPPDPANIDYAAYLAWLEEGNTPLEVHKDVKPYTWDSVKEDRDKLLKDSDWTMIPGCSVDQAAWAAYRQILRDIPQTFALCEPSQIVWPTAPSTAGPNTTTEEAVPGVELDVEIDPVEENG